MWINNWKIYCYFFYSLYDGRVEFPFTPKTGSHLPTVAANHRTRRRRQPSNTPPPQLPPPGVAVAVYKNPSSFFTAYYQFFWWVISRSNIGFVVSFADTTTMWVFRDLVFFFILLIFFLEIEIIFNLFKQGSQDTFMW